ncbi:fibronectin type III domain-containing protein [Hydrogenimonas sp.]
MKFWIRALFYGVLTIVATGCSMKNAGGTPEIRRDLPPVESLRSISSMTAVGLEWKMVPTMKIEGYRIYRLDPDAEEKKFARVAEIRDRYSTHYVDTKLSPGKTYLYRISTYGKEGYESSPSESVRVQTAPMIHSVSFVRAITDLPNRIKLIWRPHQDFRVIGYIVERATVTKPDEWKKEAEIKNRLSAEYMDKNLGDGEVYMYRVRVKLCNGLVSGPSTPVKAITKPLPQGPRGLTATMDLPRRIHLEWRPSPTPDVVFYKVYRAPFPLGFYSYRAKVTGTAFDDHVAEDGKEYYYKVTAVDKDGLESRMPEAPVIGSTLPKPSAPTVTAAKVAFNQAIILWKPIDNRAEKYDVIRSHWEGLSKKEKRFTNIYGTKLVDRTLRPGVKYTYRVVEVDRNGIASDPSDPVELYIPVEGE